jgi:colanic acid/amylovoran biosynthesis glycosyltransferase
MSTPSTVSHGAASIGYVVKRYPRFSETFVVNEILAHEAAGTRVAIAALSGPVDAHFQDSIAKVRAPVHYLPTKSSKAADLWSLLHAAAGTFPRTWSVVEANGDVDVRTLHQGLALAELVRARGWDHLHAHFATSAAEAARLASALTGVPFTFTAHAKDIFHESVDPDDLERKLAAAAAVVTVSDFNVRHLSASSPMLAHKLVRIYNGLDLDAFGYHDPARRAPEILAVGRLVEKKGFRYLVDACRELAARGVDFACTIVGGGEEEDDLRARVRDAGLQDLVALTGPLPQSEVKERMRRAAAVAVPCVVGADANQDGLPTVLLEAMALGTPTVSTDVTGIPEVLVDGATGLMVPQRDPVALADALQRLLGGPTTGSRWRNGRGRGSRRRSTCAARRARCAASSRGAPEGGARCGSCTCALTLACRPSGARGPRCTCRRSCGRCARRATTSRWSRVASATTCPTTSRTSSARAADRRRARRRRPRARRWRATPTSPRASARSGVDLVYERYALWSAAGMQTARALGVPGVLEVNAPLVDEQAAHRGLVPATRRSRAPRPPSRGDRIVAVSDAVAAYRLGFAAARGKVVVVPNGVDPHGASRRSSRNRRADLHGRVRRHPQALARARHPRRGVRRSSTRSTRTRACWWSATGPSGGAFEARSRLAVRGRRHAGRCVPPAEVPAVARAHGRRVAPYPDRRTSTSRRSRCSSTSPPGCRWWPAASASSRRSSTTAARCVRRARRSRGPRRAPRRCARGPRGAPLAGGRRPRAGRARPHVDAGGATQPPRASTAVRRRRSLTCRRCADSARPCPSWCRSVRRFAPYLAGTGCSSPVRSSPCSPRSARACSNRGR